MLQLLPSPRRYTPGMDKKALWFRHPWVVDDDKKGKLIRIGIAKLTREDQGKLFDDLHKLLDKSPTNSKDAPAVDRRVLDPYFRAIKLATPPEYDIDYKNSFKPVLVNKESGERTEIPLMDPVPDDYYVTAAIAPADGNEEAF